MKTAIYIEDGLLQLVITPENQYEKNLVSMFRQREFNMEILEGTFYGCQGGWIRHSNRPTDDHSIFLIVKEESEPVVDFPDANKSQDE